MGKGDEKYETAKDPRRSLRLHLQGSNMSTTQSNTTRMGFEAAVYGLPILVHLFSSQSAISQEQLEWDQKAIQTLAGTERDDRNVLSEAP